MPDVRFEHIVKRFGTLSVLEDLNLTVSDGEFLVLLGPSGCGKTTLLNLLAGLLDVTGGRITIGDRDVTELDPSQRGLAMVFQSYALYPTKTVEGNLRFGLAAQKLDRAEIDRRVAWAAQLLQLERMMSRKPSQLSGGQRQRVAIGRALVEHAGVLLFDEPLSNLYAKLRTEMRLEIKKLHQALHQTIVYVTHDQIEAMTMATRIAVMDQGVIQQIGTPGEIYSSPMSLFAARFIGDSNTFAGKVTRTDGNGVEVEIAGLGHIRGRNHGLSAGEKAEILVRPQHVTLAKPGSAEGQRNVVPATVERVLFLGHRTEIHVRLGDGTMFIVWAQEHGGPDVQPGAAVTLAWNVTDTFAFPGAG